MFPKMKLTFLFFFTKCEKKLQAACPLRPLLRPAVISGPQRETSFLCKPAFSPKNPNGFLQSN